MPIVTLPEQYVEVRTEIERLEADLALLKEKEKELADQLLRRFEEEGVNSIRINDCSIYLRRIVRANVASPYAFNLLKKHGLGRFVVERLKDEKGLAETLEAEGLALTFHGVVDIFETFTVCMRRLHSNGKK